VQLTALVFEVPQVLLVFWRYLAGWMLMLELRWHDVQSMELLCFDLLLNVAFPFVPWHEEVQYVLLGSENAGLSSVLLCSQPVEWHCVHPGLEELYAEL